MDSLSKLQESLDFNAIKTENVGLKEFDLAGITADVLRLDRIHPIVSGNKWFKLKYHLDEAVKKKATTILTFGGSWSNHIVATAWACREAGISSIGIIRGEEPAVYSDTLKTASGLHMKLVFVSREQYRNLNATRVFPGMPENTYTIPAGGEGPLGVHGASEILSMTHSGNYTHILCSIGTATMFTGLVLAAGAHQTVIGVPALKGFNDIPGDFKDMINAEQNHARWHIANNYHFGGYARRTPELSAFMNLLHSNTGIETDFVYTGKLFYASVRMAAEKIFARGSRLLIIHSGGLQGNSSLPDHVLNF